MKQIFSLLFFSLFIVACGGPAGEEVDSGEAVATDDGQSKDVPSMQYLVDPTASKVTWEGSKLIGGGHTGEIPVENGQIIVTKSDNKIVAGRFAMDLRNLTNTDLKADEGRDKLVGHLQSEDFFDVAKYPMANFDLASINKVEGKAHTHEFLGNLTLKGQSRSVTIPANIEMKDNQMHVTTPQFVIDRTEWGVSYGSGGLGLDLAKDKIINDEVGLKIDLVANAE